MEKTKAVLDKMDEAETAFRAKLETFRDQAAALVDLIKQYKELTARFDSAENDLRRRLREVQEREDLIGAKEKEAEEKCKSNLLSLKSLITEHVYEIDVLNVRIGERREDLVRVERAVVAKKEELEGVKRDCELKRGELRLIEKCENGVELREERIREKEKVIELLKEGLVREVEQQGRELELKERRVESRSEEVDLKEKRINERFVEVELKEKAAVDRGKELDSVQKSVQEREKVMELQEEGLEKKAIEVELKERRVELRIEELNAKDKRIGEHINEVQEKEKFLEAFEKSIQKEKENLDSRSHGLEMREREVEKQAKELELKQKQFDSERTAKNVILVSPTSDQSWMNMDGRSLQLVMVEQLEKIDLAGGRMSAALQAASDPAKLVLDAMQGFYPSNVDVENTEFETHLRIVRKSCIILLQELQRISPLISPQVRQEAVKLAADWKEKISVTSDNGWEALGLLRLIITYKLTSIYDLRELQRLLGMVSQPDQAAEIRRALGITDKEPATNIVPSTVKTKRSKPSLVRNEAILSPPDNCSQDARIVSLPSMARTEGPKSFGAGATLSSPSNAEGPESSVARQAATLSPPKSSEGPEASLAENAAAISSPNDAVHTKLLLALRSSSDPAKLVLDLIKGSLTDFWRNGDVSSIERVVLRIIALLKILIGLSPHVGPHLKENATSLASQWKEELRAGTEDSLESLGYLLFVAVYGLHANLHEDDIVILLRKISQNKVSLELCQAHGFADYIPDFMRKLIEKKLLMEAVRSICSLELFDKLPPAPLLHEYVGDLMQCSEVIRKSHLTPAEKDRALNGKIADLRAVIQCIKDYNLESVYPSKNVEMQIVPLEMLKENWRSSAPFLVPKVELKPCTGSSAPKPPPEKRQKITLTFRGSRP